MIRFASQGCSVDKCEMDTRYGIRLPYTALLFGEANLAFWLNFTNGTCQDIFGNPVCDMPGIQKYSHLLESIAIRFPSQPPVCPLLNYALDHVSFWEQTRVNANSSSPIVDGLSHTIINSGSNGMEFTVTGLTVPAFKGLSVSSKIDSFFANTTQCVFTLEFSSPSFYTFNLDQRLNLVYTRQHPSLGFAPFYLCSFVATI